jgi:LysM repeat protein
MGQSSGKQYKIVPGDTLSSIAEQNGLSLQALEAANKDISNPNLIYPGKTVTIPTVAASQAASSGSTAGTAPQAVIMDSFTHPLKNEAEKSAGGNTTGADSSSPEAQVFAKDGSSESTSTQPKSWLQKLFGGK